MARQTNISQGTINDRITCPLHYMETTEEWIKYEKRSIPNIFVYTQLSSNYTVAIFIIEPATESDKNYLLNNKNTFYLVVDDNKYIDKFITFGTLDCAETYIKNLMLFVQDENI